MRLILTMVAMCFSVALFAAPKTEEAASPKIRYKAGKDLNFDELLVQGEVKRPEVSVVTAEEDQGTNALLRLRKNFNDRIVVDFGEAVE